VILRVISWIVLCLGSHAIHEITRNYTKEVSVSLLRNAMPATPRFYFLTRWIRLSNLIELIRNR
jgi:hypothetical protein